jgi:hypothetical protein
VPAFIKIGANIGITVFAIDVLILCIGWPNYASSICVELWSTQDGKHYVRVLYDCEEVAVPIS